MVSLSLMARLVEAVRPEARLILVGDPGQLTSIEAGAVLGDIVGPAARRPAHVAAAREPPPGERSPACPCRAAPGADGGDGIVVLDRVHRYGGGHRARSPRRSAAATPTPASTRSPPRRRASRGSREPPTPSARDSSRPAAAVAAGPRRHRRPPRPAMPPRRWRGLGAFRLLCAHRRGAVRRRDVDARASRRWLADGVDGFGAAGAWYAGRPLLVTENDYGLRLFNGDTGVVVRDRAAAASAPRSSAAASARGQPARGSARSTRSTR